MRADALAPKDGGIVRLFYSEGENICTNMISQKMMKAIFYKLKSSSNSLQRLQQITKTKNAFIVKDYIEFGYQNIIPLWAFGLNYLKYSLLIQ